MSGLTKEVCATTTMERGGRAVMWYPLAGSSGVQSEIWLKLPLDRVAVLVTRQRRSSSRARTCAGSNFVHADLPRGADNHGRSARDEVSPRLVPVSTSTEGGSLSTVHASDFVCSTAAQGTVAFSGRAGRVANPCAALSRRRSHGGGHGRRARRPARRPGSSRPGEGT